jgi:hypothetical protein
MENVRPKLTSRDVAQMLGIKVAQVAGALEALGVVAERQGPCGRGAHLWPADCVQAIIETRRAAGQAPDQGDQ